MTKPTKCKTPEEQYRKEKRLFALKQKRHKLTISERIAKREEKEKFKQLEKGEIKRFNLQEL